jgi:hypothetical protein
MNAIGATDAVLAKYRSRESVARARGPERRRRSARQGHLHTRSGWRDTGATHMDGRPDCAGCRVLWRRAVHTDGRTAASERARSGGPHRGASGPTVAVTTATTASTTGTHAGGRTSSCAPRHHWPSHSAPPAPAAILPLPRCPAGPRHRPRTGGIVRWATPARCARVAVAAAAVAVTACGAAAVPPSRRPAAPRLSHDRP